ncbi:MAG TPA: cytochrome c [Acetobacteraceae bacterium]|nr:cytochrome c [Acetobacteraceae bacterium]
MVRMPVLAALLASLLLAVPAHAQSAGSTARGEYLARAGDCVACHSAPGGKAFAGGLKMGTPLGAIFATNITPDIETGIGTYTVQDFGRAVRGGVAKDGRRLYPAMPYPSYAKLTDEDVQALYDYFMRAVPPVHQVNQQSEIPAYLSPRWPLAIWNALFGGGTGFTANPQKDAQWNRGAYLVEGLGHCGACHTPRGWTLAEKALDAGSPDFLAGANLDGWYAPSLRQNLATGLGGWSQSEIVEFLKTGHDRHGSAYGSMRDVINNSTPYLTDGDLDSIATYLASLPASTEQKAPVPDDTTAKALLEGTDGTPGAAIYAFQCQFCHKETGAAAPPFLPPLAGNPTVLDKDPSSLINIVLNGSAPLVVKGNPSPYRMPQYRAQLTNQQIADVVTFIRNGWGNRAPPVSASEVADLRKSTDPASDQVVILKMR